MPGAILSGSFTHPSFASQVPSLSASWKVPVQTHTGFQVSLMVHALLSSQGVPGTSGPPGTPIQSTVWPTQTQFASSWSANRASIGLHRALGFEDCGLLRSVGHKFGEWRDVVMMQRLLGPGDAAAPTGIA